MVRPRIRPSAPSAPSALKRANVSSATMRYGRGGGLRRLEKTRATGEAWGLHEQQSKTNHYLLHPRPSVFVGWLGGHACLAIAMRQASDGLHCGTWISPSGRWRRCCVCSRGSVSMRRAYVCGMQSTRAEVCGEWPTNRWVNLHEACKCGDCWIGQ
jgi:hypothetical protein